MEFIKQITVGEWIWIALLLLVIILVISYFKKLRTFTREVKVELAKATWPWEPKEKGVKKYKELIDSTAIVVIAMLLLSGYIATWDFLLIKIVGGLTN